MRYTARNVLAYVSIPTLLIVLVPQHAFADTLFTSIDLLHTSFYSGSLGTKIYTLDDNSPGHVDIVDTTDNSVSSVTVGNYPESVFGLGTKVYVGNAGSGALSIIDTSSGNAVTNVAGGGSTYDNKATTAIGTKVYSADGNRVKVVDTANGNALSYIATGKTGGTVVIPFGTLLLQINAATPGSVSIIDTANGDAVTNVTVGNNPYDAATVGTKIYVPNNSSNTVSVIDTGNGNTVTSVSVGTSPRRVFAFGTKVYVANYSAGTISVIDTADNDSVSTLSGFSHNQPQYFASIGTKLYVAGYGYPNVKVIDTADNNSITTVSIPNSCIRGLHAIGTRVYALDECNSGQLHVIGSDTTAPTVSNVSSDTANGSYNEGDTIDIDVTFSEAVTSTGNVTVALETGDTDRTCTFTAASASTGTCTYTVQAGDTTSDLTVSTISGTIADAAGNAMSNFVPATNLAANKALVVDTTAPTITLTGSATVSLRENDSYTDAGATASDAVDGDITDDIVLTGSVDTSTLGTYTLTYNVSDAAGNAATSNSRTVTVKKRNVTSSSSNSSRVGPSPSVPATPAPTTPSPSAKAFTRNTFLGTRGEDVRALQQYLNTHGFPVTATGPGSSGAETDFFGALTRAALIKFQKANNIVPAVGYFGPITRGVMGAGY